MIYKLMTVQNITKLSTHSSSIPERQSFVGRAGDQGVGERKEFYTVHRISMAAQSVPASHTETQEI